MAPISCPSALQVLMDWINAELLPEHIVVRSLEEDIFDGLILHHLFRKSLLSAPGSPRRQRGPAWGSLGALCRALGRQLQDRPVGHSFLSSCHGAGTVNRQHSCSVIIPTLQMRKLSSERPGSLSKVSP